MTLKLIPASEMIRTEIELPDVLKEEAQSFLKRNYIVSRKYCKRCLKAHVLKKAKENRLGKEVYLLVENKFANETGHNGYYMDGGEVIEI